MISIFFVSPMTAPYGRTPWGPETPTGRYSWTVRLYEPPGQTWDLSKGNRTHHRGLNRTDQAPDLTFFFLASAFRFAQYARIPALMARLFADLGLPRLPVADGLLSFDF